MIKKLMIPIIFLLSIQIVFAMYGGESEIIHSFPQCLNMSINVNASSTIEEGEFSLLGCSKINQNYWECDCNDGFDLILTTDPRTVNDYSFDILYYWKEGEEPIPVKTSGGSRNYRSVTITTIPPIIPITGLIEEEKEEAIVVETGEEELDITEGKKGLRRLTGFFVGEEGKVNTLKGTIIASVIVCVGLIAYFKFRKKKK